jgi:hypothetical protein
MIESVAIDAAGNADVDGFLFDARTLAWNAINEYPVSAPVIPDRELAQVLNLKFDTTAPTFTNCVGTLRWDRPNDARISGYYVKGTKIPMWGVGADTEWFDIGYTQFPMFDIPSLVGGTYALAVAPATAGGKMAPKWSSWTGSHWAMVDAGVSAIVDGSTMLVNANLYVRSLSLPPTPLGGVFDFSQMALTSIPQGWHASPPNGADTLWQSRSVAESSKDVYVDSSLEWTTPVAVYANPLRIYLEPSAVAVLQDDAGVNFNYSFAKGNIKVIHNEVDQSISGSVTYSIANSVNAAATLNTSNTLDKGHFQVTSLTGDTGEIVFQVDYLGDTTYVGLTVGALLTGYVKDLTPPPAPVNLDITAGFTTIFVVLPEYPGYAEGHGHGQSNVYVGRVIAGDPVPLIDDATKLEGFRGEFNSYSLDQYDTSGTGVWSDYDYYIWVKYETQDGVEGDPSIPYLASFELIRTNLIEDFAVVNSKIANAAIDSAKIANAAITNAKIANASIDNAKIIDATITGAKIGTAQINTAHIIDASIVSVKIATASIYSAHIVDLTANKITAGTIGAGVIHTGELNISSAGSGARMTMKNSVIKVYDANGTLRVKLGNLAE